MIEYQCNEERLVFLYFADLLNDMKARELIDNGLVSSREDATYLSKFFWRMVDESANNITLNIKLPCEGSPQYWTEKLYNSVGGYLEKAGYENEWNTEIDNA